MSVKDHVKGLSSFSHYRAGNMYYVTDTGLEFPIPVTDVEGATLTAQDKSMFFMRWIRQHIKTLEQK